MKEPNRILFVSQQIFPYLDEETPIRLRNRQLPEFFQSKGFETRTFMPKFGDINERRNQLHEVIRLSGINLIIADSDHPLLIKVASIQSARIQIYFIDNEYYFKRPDMYGNFDDGERYAFFCKAVMQMMPVIGFYPDILHAHDWQSALSVVYLKTEYRDVPEYKDMRAIYTIHNIAYQGK